MTSVSVRGAVAISLLSIMILSSIAAPLLAPYPPNETDMTHRLLGPTLSHPLGTDALGRDLLSRALYGGRASMLLSLAATLLSMSFGLVIGLLAGFYGGALDRCATALTTVSQGLPGTCLMIAIAGVLGPGIKSLLLALSITSWAGFARITRTETLRISREPFIEGLRCLGCGDGRLLLRHVLPNTMSTTLIMFTVRVGRSVLSIASLSFLGLGVAPPTPDWSVMINDARMHYRGAPHLIIVPGLCIFFLLLGINMLGDELRDRFDVKNGEYRE